MAQVADPVMLGFRATLDAAFGARIERVRSVTPETWDDSPERERT